MTVFVLSFLANRYVLHVPSATTATIFPSKYRHIDFHCFEPRFRDFHHRSFFARDRAHELIFMYPAPSALVYQAFYRTQSPLRNYQAAMGAGTLMVAFLFAQVLAHRGLGWVKSLEFTAMLLLCSWPLIINFYVTNIEIVLGFTLGVGLLFFAMEWYWSAAAFIAVAGAMKIFPFIFLMLLWQRRLYKQIAFAICIAVVLTLVSLWFVSGSIRTSWNGIAGGLENFRTVYALGFGKHDVGIDHSLWGLTKTAILLSRRPEPSVATLAPWLRLYLATTALAGFTLYLVRIHRLPVLNTMLCLVLIGILFTPASHDYTLMHLYVPFGLLTVAALDATRQGAQLRGLPAVFLCMAVALAPLSELRVNGLSLGGALKAVDLTILLILALRYPFPLPGRRGKAEDAFRPAMGAAVEI